MILPTKDKEKQPWKHYYVIEVSASHMILTFQQYQFTDVLKNNLSKNFTKLT